MKFKFSVEKKIDCAGNVRIWEHVGEIESYFDNEPLTQQEKIVAKYAGWRALCDQNNPAVYSRGQVTNDTEISTTDLRIVFGNLEKSGYFRLIPDHETSTLNVVFLNTQNGDK